jgi:ribonuclease D
LLQISGQKEAFIIDLLSLNASDNLNKMLQKVFGNPKALILGFSFGSDKLQFKRALPKYNFLYKIKNFIDIQDLYDGMFKNPQSTSLSNVSLNIFKRKLCKTDTFSDWEQRPLS